MVIEPWECAVMAGFLKWASYIRLDALGHRRRRGDPLLAILLP
jgi:hypothetical protein